MTLIPMAQVGFHIYQNSFRSIIGPSPSIKLLAEDAAGLPVFHEACVYHPPTKSVFITSNQIPLPAGESDPSTSNKKIIITRVYDESGETGVISKDVTPPQLVMANGGVNYKSGILFCAQGNKANSPPGGMVLVADVEAPSNTENLISSYLGRPFNSPNDVVVHPEDGSIWFTDPSYGFYQGIRPEPELPNQVYRFDPRDKSIRAVADDFVRPNGLSFSPDFKLLYVTDTGAISGAANASFDKAGEASIYAFDVSDNKNGPFLTNRRLFAFADNGIPDGIKCDTEGNVYSGCGDGVNVWNSGGELIGKILIDGGVANFCFGEKGAMYICNESKFWKAQLGDQVRGALLGL